MKIIFNKYWFKPKRFGYGATPVTWEGWLSTLIFVLLIIWFAYRLKDTQNTAIFIIEVIILAVAFGLFAKRKTKEKWNWRWK